MYKIRGTVRVTIGIQRKALSLGPEVIIKSFLENMVLQLILKEWVALITKTAWYWH